MANKKISELPVVTVPNNADLLPVVQSGVTSQITRANFLSGVTITPGGSDKNVQYNNSGALGGVSNNATATNKYLQQVSSGTPSFQQVAGADLSMSDVTTNNASTSNHGFLKKLDNNSAHFMDGQGNWSTPSGVSDASALTYTPADNTDWTSSADPGNTDDALDQLADRLKTVEGLLGGAGADSDILVIIGDGVNAISTGVVCSIPVDFACTIGQVTLLADQTGSIVVDIWKDTYANYPPTNADSITASAKPTISTATKSQDSTLTGWTTAISAGDVLKFNVDSATTVTRVTLALKVTR